MKIVFRLVLSLISTAILTGCNPPSDSKPSQFKFGSISEKASICEAKIRRQMLEKSLLLKNVAGLPTISEANNQLASLDKTDFSATEIQKEFTEIGLSYYKFDEKNKVSFQYGLSNSNHNTNAVLSLSVSADMTDPFHNVKITQQFLVGESCGLTLSQTTQSKLEKVNASDYTYSNLVIYSDGGQQADSDRFSLPESGILMNLRSDASNMDKVPPAGFVYIFQLGVTSYTLTPNEVVKATEFGVELSLKSVMLNLSAKGKQILTSKFSEDKTAHISVTEISNQKSWTIPQNIWQNLNLGNSENLNNYVQYQLPKDYLKTNSTIILESAKPPKYDHFSAYWKISNSTFDNKTGKTTQVLTESVSPIVNDMATAVDLESNDTIQTELPQIQAIAKEILSQKQDRVGQIALILNYLSEHYKFDEEMIKNNVVRPLTTQEALNRGKGVCQHYAVLFTTIARALKIPTRIVIGYLLADNSAGMHAWVESEIQPGVWRVIEPQSRTSLDSIYTRFYVPMVRARNLENKNEKSGELSYEIFLSDYVLKPIR